MICKFNTQNNKKKVIWEITNKCNFNCKYCIFDTQNNFTELNYKKCIEIIDDLIKNGFDYIKFTGGEPFTRKDFIDILKYANNKINFDISTNASLITDDIVEQLKNIKINFIHVSLDGLKEYNDFMRGTNNFEKTIEGINKLKKSGKYLRIGCVLFKENESKIKEFVNILETLSVDEVIFSIMEPFGSFNGDKTHYITKSLSELENEITDIKSTVKISYNWNKDINNKTTYCPAGKDILFIDNNGTVSPCSWISKINTNYNKSLKNNKLTDILASYNFLSSECIYDKEGNNE